MRTFTFGQKLIILLYYVFFPITFAIIVQLISGIENIILWVLIILVFCAIYLGAPLIITKKMINKL